jgi:hypothetical protein
VAILYIEARERNIASLATLQRIRFDRRLSGLAIETHVAQLHQ